MPRVLVNVASGGWAVHFIGPDGQTRVGPWLLFDSGDEVKTILRWGGITASQLAEYENDIRRWNFSSIGLELSEAQFRRLIERGIGWPWNGYELLKMKAAGKYPPVRLTVKRK